MPPTLTPVLLRLRRTRTPGTPWIGEGISTGAADGSRGRGAAAVLVGSAGAAGAVGATGAAASGAAATGGTGGPGGIGGGITAASTSALGAGIIGGGATGCGATTVGTAVLVALLPRSRSRAGCGRR